MGQRVWFSRLLVIGAFVVVIVLALAATRAAYAQDDAGHATTIYFPQAYRSAALVGPMPTPGALDQSLNTILAWRFVESTLPDPRFTVLLEAADDTPDVVAADALSASHLDPGTLELNTAYYWQVIAAGSDGERIAGPVWNFRTEAAWDTPPAGITVTVPAGEFLMGCDTANPGPTFGCSHKDVPLHRVWLDAYAIDKFEVTNGQYMACVRDGACDWPRKSKSHTRGDYLTNPEYSFFPVLFVSRWDAIDYCTWAGKRLPTEAEWEKAARGPVDTRPFPWGDEYPDCTRANRPTAQSCPDEPQDTARIGSYPRGASPYGVHDLSGNLFEWVVDKYDEGYYWGSPNRNPANTRTGGNDFYVIRGGSYRDRIAYMRVLHRHFGHHGDTVGGDSPFYRSDRVGFRCAQSLP